MTRRLVPSHPHNGPVTMAGISPCVTTPCVPLANAARLTTRNALNNSHDAFFCMTAVSVVDRFKPTPSATETHWQRLDQLEVRLRDIRKYLWTAKQANKAELKGGKRKYKKKKEGRKHSSTSHNWYVTAQHKVGNGQKQNRSEPTAESFRRTLHPPP